MVAWAWGAAAATMGARVSRHEIEQISALIGAIYDCAVDPQRWDKTLEELTQFLDCVNCVLSVVDLDRSTFRIQRIIGIEPYWVARMAQYGPDLVELYKKLPDLHTRPIDEPISPWRDVGGEAVKANGYYRNWAQPQRLIDSIAVALMRTPSRRAEVSLGRSEDVGIITEREVRLLRLLAPHLRRAVTISDLIDMKSLEGNALGETLDALVTGVVLVAEDSAIVHANRAAQRMFTEGWPIRSVNGRLSAAAARPSERLRGIVAAAAGNDAEIGAAGIGMALAVSGEGTATAHVLPLARSDLGRRLAPRATAAVFVSSDAERPVGGLAGIADAFGLTPAETRLLGRLVLGGSIDAAASALGVAKPTVKTHLARILSKTGTRRQTDLLALVHRLAAPTGVGGDNARM
jgi:DNA-binding CsgD family transcriptional regulator